jgi:hypothetical protein
MRTDRRLLVAILAATWACACAQRAHEERVTPVERPAMPTGFPARCHPDEIEVLLLGIYHMDNPGLDAVKTEVDDVLAPSRQAELDSLVRRLAKWRPDQVAVEWPLTFADSTRSRFERYTAGTLSPSRNEVVQIGFRLAKQLGHATVYPIDHPMPIGNDSIGPLFDRRPDLKRAADSVTAVLQARADSVAPLRRRQSVIEQLREANSERALRRGNSEGMFGALLPAGEGGNYGGPQVLARWYERNIRMGHNLYRSLRPTTRRVIVIVGSGHVPPLRNLLDEAPQFCPVSPLPFLQ